MSLQTDTESLLIQVRKRCPRQTDDGHSVLTRVDTCREANFLGLNHLSPVISLLTLLTTECYKDKPIVQQQHTWTYDYLLL